ncbi:hypothetical protein CQW23_07012 [Capsicum baccatum]|uniref:Aldehyde dehydrogenase domain-containing protein n=1 Tax=Capsicum baccatum TaxID=33114 RepID=A0A2G2X524_CAPBA|nr:hypothetical protein CQW23_07012 [Capsicum baccatum]
MVQSKDNSEVNFTIPKIKFTKLFINGEFMDSVSGNTFEMIDPRNEDIIARIAEGNKDDVDLAVKTACEAFDNGPWPRLAPKERRKIMLKFADLVLEHVEKIAALDAMDAGKLFSAVKTLEVPNVAEVLCYYAGAADKIHGTTLKMSSEIQGYTLFKPIGVVGHIIPWNFLSLLFAYNVSPTLAAGCTMVVKLAEQTPLSALYYAYLAKQAAIPDGVINVVAGFGHTTGAELSSHMDVDKMFYWVNRSRTSNNASCSYKQFEIRITRTRRQVAFYSI